MCVVQLDDVTLEHDVERVHEWLQANQIAVLNVAGPRESQSPGIYAAARRLLGDVVDALVATPPGDGGRSDRKSVV